MDNRTWMIVAIVVVAIALIYAGLRVDAHRIAAGKEAVRTNTEQPTTP